MTTGDAFWWLVSTLSMVIGVAWLAIFALHTPDVLRRHFFFLFTALTVLVYLEIGPWLTLLGEAPDIVRMLALSPPTDHLRDYALVQFYALLGFLLPLFAAYVVLLPRRRRTSLEGERTRPGGVSLDRGGGWRVVVCSLAFLSAYVWALAVHDLFFSRLGPEEAAARIVALPTAEFVIIRSYQEGSLFILGVLFLVWARASGALRRTTLLAIALNLGVIVSTSLLNSRQRVVLASAAALGYWLTTRARPVAIGRQFATACAAAAFALYLAIVVVNVRSSGFELRLDAFDPTANALFGDTQGVARLNCVDLMARMRPRIEQEGPAWGQAWGNLAWTVGRFVDPEGFDRYRLSLQTTSKSYLMARYLRLNASDYFSCTATDLFGNFHVIGFLAGGLVIGGLLAWTSRRLTAPTSGLSLLAAAFVLANLLSFEQEAGTLLVGWTRLVPLLIALAMLGPFRRTPVAPRAEDDVTMRLGAPSVGGPA